LQFTLNAHSVKDIVPLLREAFRQAQSGVPGPVFVEFPIDTLYPYTTIVKELVPEAKGERAPSIGQRIANWYLNNYLNRLFGGQLSCSWRGSESRRCI
jgi:acetolactate synthase-like protein